MKSLIFIIALGFTLSSFAESAEANKNEIIEDSVAAGAMGITATIAGSAGTFLVQDTVASSATGEILIPVVGVAVTAVASSAISGYLIGDLIVKADEVYFSGKLVSVTGVILRPIFKRVYNLTHKDRLPEYLEVKGGSIKILR